MLPPAERALQSGPAGAGRALMAVGALLGGGVVRGGSRYERGVRAAVSCAWRRSVTGRQVADRDCLWRRLPNRRGWQLRGRRASRDAAGGAPAPDTTVEAGAARASATSSSATRPRRRSTATTTSIPRGRRRRRGCAHALGSDRPPGRYRGCHGDVCRGRSGRVTMTCGIVKSQSRRRGRRDRGRRRPAPGPPPTPRRGRRATPGHG